MSISFIYKITNTVDEQIYVGSSKNINKRFTGHKTAANGTNPESNKYKMKICAHMRLHGCDKFSIHFLEGINYENKSEVLERERHWIETLQPSLNGVLPIVSAEETARRVKEWHTSNKAHVKAYKANRYQEKRTEILAKQKIYSANNAVAQRAKAKAWAAANQQTTTCGCGSIVKRCQQTKHVKTQKHRNFINKVEDLVPDTHNKCDCGSIYRKRDKSQHMKTKKHGNYLQLFLSQHN